MFTVSSPKELTVGTLLNSSLHKLLERCQAYKSSHCDNLEKSKNESSPKEDATGGD